jgi:hypothetical protein
MTKPPEAATLCTRGAGVGSEKFRALPAPDERRNHDGIVFLVYKRGATTAVFWQEGEIVCAAVSTLPTDDVVAIAFAKAIRS